MAAGTACVDLPQSPDPEPQKTETEVNRDTLKWREAFLRSNPYLTSAQISVGASRAKNKSEIASRWAREKKIFAVRHRGQQLFPRFQFQDGLPLRVITGSSLFFRNMQLVGTLRTSSPTLIRT